ncbi:MAG TPA: RDD family protein [Solirubrobacteraceae bacterium]|nr:RDD family protein [Solirubrobacteraceae bacterium]
MQYEERTRIATPEGVELELVLAGLASRFMAEIVDAVLILLIVGGLIAVAALAGGTAGLVIFSVAVGGLMLISVLFHVAFEVLAAGRTPGKRMNGLRVVMDGGEPVGVRASAVRNLLRLLEGPPLFYAPAIVAILATRRNQRLGDLAAGTLVVREPPAPRHRRRKRRRAEPAAALAPGLRVAEWDVSAITQEELAAVRSFLSRRESFAPAARRGLARELAARLGEKVAGQPPGLPAETLLEGIAAAKSARS